MSTPKLFTALAKAQGLIEGAKKRNLNPHFKSKYADLASVWDACREELSSNGLSVIQNPVNAPPGHVALETTLAHESGESITQSYAMPIKDPQNPQAVGSALTYMRRYALMAVVGIAPEDDDANAAKGQPSPAKPAQPGKDWGPIKAEALESLDACKTDTDKRTLYSQVRGSDIDEPHKTELLFEMSKRIKESVASKNDKK